MAVGSVLLLVAFNACMGLAILMTIVSLSVPKWVVQVDGKYKGAFDCIFMSQDIISCDALGINNHLEDWQKGVIALMLISLMIAALAVVTAMVISFCLCCGKTHCVMILPILAFFAAIFVLVAIALYAGEVHNDFSNQQLFKPQFSHSYWLAIAACLVYSCGTIFGGFVVASAKNSQ